jgi:hypothetical protein
MDNLAMNAMLASQAGMSYGQWKAMQPVVEVERTPDERERVCQYCGKTFLLKTKRERKFCDAHCQKEAWYKSEERKKGKMKK